MRSNLSKNSCNLCLVFLLLFISACSINKVSTKLIDKEQTSKSITKNEEAKENSTQIPRDLMPVLAETLGRDNASYHINQESDGTYKSITKRYRFSTKFDGRGIEINPSNSSWKWSMELRGIGYGEKIDKVSSPKIKVSANRIEYQRNKLKEWYVNSPFGLEQGFTIDLPPGLNSNKESLVLEFDTHSDLKPELLKNKKSVKWKDRKGENAFEYSKLYAFDSKGKKLPAYISLSKEKLLLNVDDTSAEYPITIDPLIVTEVKKLLPAGNENDEFGFSVDIDGDTVVVGARLGDDKGDASGSAYIFERNQGGADNWGRITKLTTADGAGGATGSGVQ